LGRGGLFAAKVIALLAVLVVQVGVIVGAAYALGWSPSGGWPQAVAALALGTAAFAGLGFFLAGRLRAETNLAVANGLFLIFLLAGGIVVPLSRLPDTAAAIARVLPAEPLATALREAFTDVAVGGDAFITLGAWALVMCALAVKTFRWD
jgi:ABC-2 type transport system permease protein